MFITSCKIHAGQGDVALTLHTITYQYQAKITTSRFQPIRTQRWTLNLQQIAKLPRTIIRVSSRDAANSNATYYCLKVPGKIYCYY